MKRRGFLAALFSAPIVAKTLANDEQALKEEAIKLGESLGYENPSDFTTMAGTFVDASCVTIVSMVERDVDWLTDKHT